MTEEEEIERKYSVIQLVVYFILHPYRWGAVKHKVQFDKKTRLPVTIKLLCGILLTD